MEYDFSRVRGKIREVYGSEKAFANAIGFDRCTLSSKLNGKSEWRRDEIEKACLLLFIPIEKVSEYFFCRKSC